MAAEKALTGEVLTGPVVKIPTAVTKMSVSMTEKTDPDRAQQYVDVVCEAYDRRDQDLSKMRVLLGQMVFAVRENKLYQPKFRLFGEYLEDLEKRKGVSVATIYNAVKMIEQLAGVDTDLLGGLSVKNQNTAATAARRAEPARVKEMIIKYASLPNPQFREKLAEKGLLTKLGRPDGGKRDTGAVNLIVPGVAAKAAQRFRTLAKDHGGPAKYLNHLMSLDRSKAQAA